MRAGKRSVLRGVFFFQAEDGIRDESVTGVQTCALPILDGDSGQIFADYEEQTFGAVGHVRHLPMITRAGWQIERASQLDRVATSPFKSSTSARIIFNTTSSPTCELSIR